MSQKTVRIVYSPEADALFDTTVCVDAHHNIGQILNEIGIYQQYPQLQDTLSVGIFGEFKNVDYIPVDNDRIEIYRPLVLSPTQLRKLRAEKAQEKSLKSKQRSTN